MPYAYTGRILRVDLTSREITVEEKDEKFYRTYLGGGALGGYYLMKEMPPKVDSYDPRNIIVFAAGVTTGVPAPGLPRFGVVTKSPLTGAIGDSQAAGHFGPEMKFAGYDAIVVTGKADSLVYLWVTNDTVEIREASMVKGFSGAETTEAIRSELGDDKIKVASIGLAGENLIRYANILNATSATGRLGMGAVMGSKNLKAIAVRGTEKLELYDKATIQERAKWFTQNFKDNPDNYGLSTLGTEYVTSIVHESGQLPTRNFQEGIFEKAEALDGEEFHRYATGKKGCCFACPVSCRKYLDADEKYEVDPKYGSPEYEAVASLGSNCGVGDTLAVAKANEICNRYGMDVISAGASIAFTMELLEKGILSPEDVDGMDLRFGSIEAQHEMLEKIARREGFGDLLAEGSKRAAEEIGKGSEKYAIHAKGQELAMHDPRAKGMVGFGYAVYGGDHVIVEHDSDFDEHAPELYMEQIKCMSLYDRISSPGMDPYKVKMFVYLQYQWSFFDSLGVCVHAYAPIRTFKMRDLVTLLDASTGWESSLWELMKAGERRVNLFKMFNYREGFRAEDDTIPERFFDPIPEGPQKGNRYTPEMLEEAKQLYYEMMNWDPKTSRPNRAKLIELDLDWVLDTME